MSLCENEKNQHGKRMQKEEKTPKKSCPYAKMKKIKKRDGRKKTQKKDAKKKTQKKKDAKKNIFALT